MFSTQGDSDPAVKLEFDDDGLGGEGVTGENSVAKPKAPRVKKEKKEPGKYFSCSEHHFHFPIPVCYFEKGQIFLSWKLFEG